MRKQFSNLRLQKAFKWQSHKAYMKGVKLTRWSLVERKMAEMSRLESAGS